MSRSRQPLFLERQSYRRRRLIDASRLIPVFGLFLFLVPLIWPEMAPGETDLAARGLYIFAVWFALVAITGFLSHRLNRRATGAGWPDTTTDTQTDEARDDVL